jgi:uncharacterized protein YneF (UPF0154 family)
MTAFFYLLVILTIIVCLFATAVIGWAFIAIKRKEKGLHDFKKCPFFNEPTTSLVSSMKLKYLDLEKTPKKKQKTTEQRQEYCGSFSINEEFFSCTKILNIS